MTKSVIESRESSLVFVCMSLVLINRYSGSLCLLIANNEEGNNGESHCLYGLFFPFLFLIIVTQILAIV